MKRGTGGSIARNSIFWKYRISQKWGRFRLEILGLPGKRGLEFIFPSFFGPHVSDQVFSIRFFSFKVEVDSNKNRRWKRADGWHSSIGYISKSPNRNPPNGSYKTFPQPIHFRPRFIFGCTQSNKYLTAKWARKSRYFRRVHSTPRAEVVKWPQWN